MSKIFSTPALEVIAQNAIKEYNPELASGEPCAIPIEELIELHYGLKIKYLKITKNGYIHGLTAFNDCQIPIYDMKKQKYIKLFLEQGTIVIDNSLLYGSRVKRLRYTLAHELAHWLIHEEYYLEKCELASKTSCDSSHQTECEADKLAAALLMPTGRVKVAFQRLRYTLNTEALINQMAIIFEVSQQSMSIRLKSLNFIP